MQALRSRAWLACLLAAATAGQAAELDVVLVDQAGKPVADAVVSLVPETDIAVPTVRAPTTRTINQQALNFDRYVEVFRPGDKVLFRNSDRTSHHVYSFSPAKSFEYMVSPGASAPALELDQPGVIAVGCNIHDQMVTYLYVSDAPWIARSGAEGKVSFKDLPAGSYNVRAWQPRLRPGKPDLRQSTKLLSGDERGSVRFELALLPDARRQFDRETTRY